MNWTLKQGNKTTDWTSFPYAFRTMWSLINKAKTEKKPINTSEFTILGPVNSRGERNKYNFSEAKQMALDQGLIDTDGLLNGKEFKRKR